MSVALSTLGRGDTESPRVFVIQSVYQDMMVVERTAGTFASLLEAYECIVDNIVQAGGFIKSLLANPQMGVACVKIRVHRQDFTYLITPDDREYTLPRFIPATIDRRNS